jgi:hypothetical protein
MIVALVIVLQGVMGFGIVRHVESLRGTQVLSLSFLLGLPLSSVAVLGMDLASIPLTTASIGIAFSVAVVLTNLGFTARTKKAIQVLRPQPPSVRLYDLVFLIVIGVFVVISVWQCVRLPVIPRDAIVGMDLVAKYAVAEGTINSSVFTGEALRGQLSNQPYYAPFTMLMQVVYRLAGMPFGKLWLSILFISFLIFLYDRLRHRLHPIAAGFLALAFVTIPNMFTYTYFLLTDYSNALFFGIGALFLHDFLRSRRPAQLVMGALFMGFACWSRSETITFIVPGILLLFLFARDRGWIVALRQAGLAVFPSVFLLLLWHGLYFGLVFDDPPSSAGQLFSAGAPEISATIGGMLRLLGDGDLYGSFFYLFAACLILNLVFFRDRTGASLLLWIVILFVGFVFVVQVFDAASVKNTVKRGYFKLFPIMVFYLGESRLWGFVSEKLRVWEGLRPNGA